MVKHRICHFEVHVQIEKKGKCIENVNANLILEASSFFYE